MRGIGCITVLVFVLLVSGTLLLLGSCATDPTKGYVAGTVFDDSVQTISIPIFENETYDRDIEFQLTDALIKELEARTPWKVQPSSRADTELLGKIQRVQRDQLSKSPLTGLSEEMVVSITVDFTWRDLRTGQVRIHRRDFTGHGLFVPSRPTGETIELGETAAVVQLARDIVDEMAAEW
jgi:hypothetical protein